MRPTLYYSSCNEDWRTERKALAIEAGNRVLCIAGGGDRPLHLLLDEPGEVVAVDANPAQLELLRLKAEAMRAFEYDVYSGFLGLAPMSGTERVRRLREVSPALPPESLRHWETAAADVRVGVIYRGRFERHYARVSLGARIVRGRKIARLFAFRDLGDQREFVRREWDSPAWRALNRALCSRLFSRVALGDPAFYAHVDPGMDIGGYVYERMRASLERHLARENFMLSLLLRGRLANEDLPPYLAREGVAAIRPKLGRLSFRNEDIIGLLESAAPGSFDRFSLSDVPSYLGQPDFERLLAAMVRAARPGARFCIRYFLTSQAVPGPVARRLARENALERELELEDRAFAYRFLVGTVKGEETGAHAG